MMMAAVIALVSGSTCHKADTKAALDEPIRLRKGQWVSFTHGLPLEIAFLRVVQDSRCPRNVQCIRAGDAVVQFAAKSAEGGMSTFLAQLPEGAPTDSIAWADWSDYRVRVLELEPYPVGGVTVDSSAYVVTFVVKKG
jgi:hypothetical protein